MAVADDLDNLPRPIDAGVNLRLGRSRTIAFENLAADIDDQNIVGRDAGAAGVAHRYKKAIGARQPRADMAAIVEKLSHDHHAGAVDKLLPQFLFH